MIYARGARRRSDPPPADADTDEWSSAAMSTFRESILNHDAPTTPRAPAPAPTRHLGVAIGCLSCLAYTCVFLVQQLPGPFARAVAPLRRVAYGFVDGLLSVLHPTAAGPEWRNGLILLVLAGVIPWLVMLSLGRGRPATLGARVPNRYGWRILLVGYLVSIPFLWWMIGGPNFADRYLALYERAGGALFAGYYLVNMTTEHFLIQGVVLALCSPGRRWPATDASCTANGGHGFSAALHWLGLAQTADARGGQSRLTSWLGLPPGCVAAILTSGVIFALVHFGKHPRELLLSLPGGLAQAYIAYRTNTWLVPLVLHLATAATAFGLMLVLQ